MHTQPHRPFFPSRQSWTWRILLPLVLLLGLPLVVYAAWNDPTPMVVDTAGNVGYFTSMKVVNGNPAISYLEVGNDNLKYVRASDANGSAWSTPLILDSTGSVGFDDSLAVVNGNPAISYFDDTNGDLKYVRANEVLPFLPGDNSSGV